MQANDYDHFLASLYSATSRNDIDTVVSLWYSANVTSSFKKDKEKIKAISKIIKNAIPKIAAAQKLTVKKKATLKELAQAYDEQIILAKLGDIEEIISFLNQNPRRARAVLDVLSKIENPFLTQPLSEGRLFYWLILGTLPTSDNLIDPKIHTILQNFDLYGVAEFSKGFLEETRKTNNINPLALLLTKDSNLYIAREIFTNLLLESDPLLEPVLKARMHLPDSDEFLRSVFRFREDMDVLPVFLAVLGEQNIDYATKDALAYYVTEVSPEDLKKIIENVPYDYTFHNLAIFYLLRRGDDSGTEAIRYLAQKHGFDRSFDPYIQQRKMEAETIENIIG